MYHSEQSDTLKQGERGTREFWTPERRLLAAVLHRAVADYTGSDHTVSQEAAEWIFEEIAQPFPLFSFAWTCEQLELDARLIASAVACLPRQTSAEENAAAWNPALALSALARSSRN